jgi:pyridoxamine 5'-phosphate oxidase
MSRDLGHLREHYVAGTLRRADLAADPIAQFERWWDEWLAADRYDPAACVLATADAHGRPSARFVLCREYDAHGFVIYTNLESRKAADLTANPVASLVFGWLDQDRQVRVEGEASLLDDATVDAYWASRPRGSQLGAWASSQSAVIDGRESIEARLAEAEARYGAGDDGPAVPRPPYWGGYRVSIGRMEFWQGRPDRLHDRFAYRRDASVDGGWVIERLCP